MNILHFTLPVFCLLLSSCARPMEEVKIKSIYGYLGGEYGDVKMDRKGRVFLDGEMIEKWQPNCRVNIDINAALAPQKTPPPPPLTWGGFVKSSRTTGVIGYLGAEPNQNNYLYDGVNYFRVNDGSLKTIENLVIAQCSEPYRSDPFGED